MITGLRRSALYVPCDTEKMIVKAAGCMADVLMLNLEDGVSALRKDAARANAVQALKSLDFGAREIVVRINSLESEAGQADMESIVACRPDGICLPKVETPMAILAAGRMISELEVRCGLPEGGVKLLAMIESAAGVLGIREIASASPRMASVVFGSADYSEDVRCLPGEDRSEFLLALQMIVAGARTAGVDAIDAPCFQIRNKVQAELSEAENRGRALSTLEGNLIDNPHRSAAERILRRVQLARRYAR